MLNLDQVEQDLVWARDNADRSAQTRLFVHHVPQMLTVLRALEESQAQGDEAEEVVVVVQLEDDTVGTMSPIEVAEADLLDNVLFIGTQEEVDEFLVASLVAPVEPEVEEDSAPEEQTTEEVEIELEEDVEASLDAEVEAVSEEVSEEAVEAESVYADED